MGDDMNKQWGCGGLAIALFFVSGPAWAEAAPRAVVLTTVENMYSAPDATKDVVSQALLGEVVSLLESQQGFARVTTPDGYSGWLAESALATSPAAAPFYASQGQVAEVTSLMANLYRDPDVTTARPKLLAPLGTRLEVAPGPASKRWLSVRLPAGEIAYVQHGDVRIGDAAAPRSRGSEKDLVATARRFLGVPYLWGGMTPHGVDCSGFVSRVYLVNGVSLLRDAHLQFADPKAESVERDALRPGDLLFFGDKKITHVGMYQGDGRFIHATTHGSPVVQESELADPHWTGLYKGARRPR
jgi:gamma-D-glutamyl-L-lysine dipeptidyl-peptidase